MSKGVVMVLIKRYFLALVVLALFGVLMSACGSVAVTSSETLEQTEEVEIPAREVLIGLKAQSQPLSLTGTCPKDADSLTLEFLNLKLKFATNCIKENWEITIPPEELTDGVYEAELQDDSNAKIIEKFTFVVDTVLPIVSVTSPPIDAPNIRRGSPSNDDEDSDESRESLKSQSFEDQEGQCPKYAGYIVIPKKTNSDRFSNESALWSSSNPTTQIAQKMERSRTPWESKINLGSRAYLTAQLSSQNAKEIYNSKLAEVVTRNCLLSLNDIQPNDPLFAQSWHHPKIDMPKAWELSIGSDEITIAVVDTGIDASHPEFSRAGESILVPGANTARCLSDTFPTNPTCRTQNPPCPICNDVTDTSPVVLENQSLSPHGTQVAGVIAAVGNNGIGVAGIGWNFKIMPIRVSDRTDATAYISDLDQGIVRAAELGADVINVSFSGAFRPSAQVIGLQVRAMGALYVNSSGNTGQDMLQDCKEMYGNTSPNCTDVLIDHSSVIIVGASTQNDQRAAFSSFGAPIDVIAPGVSIRTTSPNASYSSPSGTSFSAPIVSGVLGLIRSLAPALSLPQVEEILFGTSEPVLNNPLQEGHGRINAHEALVAAIASEDYVVDDDEVSAFEFKGNCSEDGVIEVKFDDTLLATTNCDDGKWAATLDLSELPEEEVSVIEVSITDAVGNQSLSSRALYRDD